MSVSALKGQKRKHPRLLFVLSLHLIIYGTGLRAGCLFGTHRRHHSTHKYPQPIHFLRATCGPSVCGIYFNTNHTNLTNCAGVNLQLGKNSIRVSLTRPLGGSTPCDSCKIRKIRVKRNTNRIASYLEVLPRAISKIRKIRV